METCHDTAGCEADELPPVPDSTVEHAKAQDHELKLLPEKDYLFLDQHQGTWVATNILTLEQLELESGPWAIEHDESGYCVLAYLGDIPDIEHIVVSNDMAASVWTEPSGERMLINSIEGHPDKEQNFNNVLVTLKSGKISIKLGHLQAEVQLDATVFLRPRAGNKLFIGLSGLYKVLRLDAYAGSPTKWVNARCKAWEKRLGQYFSKGFLCYATGVELPHLEWHDKCLEQSQA